MTGLDMSREAVIKRAIKSDWGLPPARTIVEAMSRAFDAGLGPGWENSERQHQEENERRGEVCPDAEVCKSCPCAGDDDVCFPGERLRADRDEARREVERLRMETEVGRTHARELSYALNRAVCGLKDAGAWDASHEAVIGGALRAYHEVAGDHAIVTKEDA